MFVTSLRMQNQGQRDLHERNHRRTPEFIHEASFGQLLRIFVLHLPASPDLRTTAPKTLILAVIRKCAESTIFDTAVGIHSYSGMGAIQLVDVAAIQAVVGRMYTKDTVTRQRGWYVIDRSGSLAQVEYVDDDI